MPVQAAHKLEPPLAYAASKARQPPKLPRHKPYASCGTYPPNTMPPKLVPKVVMVGEVILKGDCTKFLLPRGSAR